jgi:predicted DNA-binding protein YlxM (UPF0122 family)
MEQELDLYVLCEHGFSVNIIKKLIKEGYTWRDFENHSEKAIKLKENKPALLKKISDVIPLVGESERENSLFQLAHGGLSHNNINTLIDIKVRYQDIKSLTLDKLGEMLGGNRQSLYNKIKKAYDSIETIKGNVPIFLIESKMYEIIEVLAPKQDFTSLELKQTIEEEFQEFVEMDLVEDFLKKNLNSGLLIDSVNGYRKKYKTILDFLEEDFLNKDILLFRMEGLTLREIAEKKNISRQAVSNKERRILNRVDHLEEVICYEKLFQSYDWNEELFCELYNEPIEVYRFLHLKYRKGSESPLSLLDAANNFNETQIELILRDCEAFIDYKGNIRSITKLSIFEDVLFYNAKSITSDEEMVEYYNQYLNCKGLDCKFQVDVVSVRGMSERCPFVIRCKSNGYRFYNFDELDSTHIGRLKSLLSLSPGIYSTVKLYSENQEFMEEIDIRSEHELHNLYKKMIDLVGVTFNRMPEFTVGSISKKEFIIKLFHEQAPVRVDEFVFYVEENYGLRANSLHSYIHMFLDEYVHEDTIRVEYHDLQDSELKWLKGLLVDDIYTVDQLNELGSVVDSDFHDKFLNNMILSKVGFNLKGKYVLNNSFETIDGYFTKEIMSKDYFSRNGMEIYNSASFNQALYGLEKNLDVIKIEKDLYITKKKLSQAEVHKSILMDFRKKALSHPPENQFFTLFSLKKAGFEHEIEDLGFEDFFYDRILWTSDEVKTIPLSTGYVFIKEESEVSLKDFIRFLIEEEEFSNIYEMKDYTESIYGISLDLSRVISIVDNSDMFYSRELSKIYINKNKYFEEIY